MLSYLGMPERGAVEVRPHHVTDVAGDWGLLSLGLYRPRSPPTSEGDGGV